jgi:predicted RNase H-like nuclease
MKLVLGIDAAWTATQPSGIALVGKRKGARWQCLAVAPSYASFLAQAPRSTNLIPHACDWRVKPAGDSPDCDALIAACKRIAGAAPDVIAIDMPLARGPFSSRRVADNEISRAYASRGLGVHTPNPLRPGPIAEAMRLGFAKHGYTVATASTKPGTPRALIEVFPHAAVIELLGADYRVPYKLSRAAQYWPELDIVARRRKLLRQWAAIRRALVAKIDGITLPPARAEKRYEDALDALVCAWIGTQYLDGRVRAYGDDFAAVWA